MLAEDRLIADTVVKFNWDPKEIKTVRFDLYTGVLSPATFPSTGFAAVMW
jgi:hypothetical protein